MKAVLLEEIGKPRSIEVASPALSRPDDVMVRERAAGIYGSEVHAYKGVHPFRKPPAILSHEVAGGVVELGPEVKSLSRGDCPRRSKEDKYRDISYRLTKMHFGCIMVAYSFYDL